jgi:hypothetical protein
MCLSIYKLNVGQQQMNVYLSPGHSVMSEIVGYLQLQDMTQTRLSTRFLKTATDELTGGWREYVHNNVQGIADCSICRALIQTIGPHNTVHKTVEWCVSCGSIVCVDHLQSINGIICCGECF